MIKITFSGGSPEASSQAKRLAASLSAGGKIVRGYDLNDVKGELPDPLPADADYVIIVEKRT